jgi:transcriptional regulator with XRE-family HTH domain
MSTPKKKPKRALTLTGKNVKPSVVNTTEIKRRREAMGMTWQQAADKAGWPVQRWGDVEGGRHDDPRISTMEAVATVLRCKVDDLLRK